MKRTRGIETSIDKDGWKKVEIEEDFLIPTTVKDHQAFLTRERLLRYVNKHPLRIYHYVVGDKEYVMDCKASTYLIRRRMRDNGAEEDDIEQACNISDQFHQLFGMATQQTKKAFGGKSQPGGVLEAKSEELLDLFGKLYTVDEVTQIIIQDWGFSVSRGTVQAFYNRNLKEIDRLRDQYSLDYSDLSLTRKRARLDKRAMIFYTYYSKWMKDPRIEYAKMLLTILEQIENEVEGEQININIQGQINVDMTMEVNKTLFEAYRRVPVNNLILAMVAAKKGIDPTKLMTQLTTSYYKSLTGYGKYDPAVELVHPVDLTYNWNDIEVKHRMKDKSVVFEEAQIVPSTGKVEKDAEMNTIKNKLLGILEGDKVQNAKRKSK